MAEKALSGVKVIEYASFIAGPYCGKLLADLGADVVKIESTGSGDEARKRGPFLHDKPHPELSGLFLYLNTNKLGITLNLETSDGREIFKKLISAADLLIEDQPPGGMKKLGMGYEELNEINTRLVMTSITPFGQTGPYSNYKAYHLNTYHASGAGYLLPAGSVNLEREPVKGPGFIGDYDAGLSAAVATLGALFWRGTSGRGQHIDVSKQEALMSLDKIELDRFQSEGTNPNRGLFIGRKPHNRMIRGKDGSHIMLDAVWDNQWQGLVNALGNPEWTKEESFCTEAARLENVSELRERLSEWAQNYDTEEIFHKIQAARSPSAMVNSAQMVLNSPQLEAREFLVEIDHPVAGKIKYPSRPYRFSRTPWKVERPAPLKGQHNKEVLCRRLGYTEQELLRFKEAGII